MGKFEIRKSTNNQYYYNLKAGNGEIILTGETYPTTYGVHGGIASVKSNALIDSRYERKISTSGHHYFVLKAANGEPLGKSEMYNSSSAMETGIASVKTNAPTAPTEDLT